jgi:hypothetical protein
LIDLLGEIERIGIGAEGSEQLRTNRDDLGVHARSVNEKAVPSSQFSEKSVLKKLICIAEN